MWASTSAPAPSILRVYTEYAAASRKMPEPRSSTNSRSSLSAFRLATASKWARTSRMADEAAAARAGLAALAAAAAAAGPGVPSIS